MKRGLFKACNQRTITHAQLSCTQRQRVQQRTISEWQFARSRYIIQDGVGRAILAVSFSTRCNNAAIFDPCSTPPPLPRKRGWCHRQTAFLRPYPIFPTLPPPPSPCFFSLSLFFSPSPFPVARENNSFRGRWRWQPVDSSHVRRYDNV